MSRKRKRFSRRDFIRLAGGTAISLPVLAACKAATEEATEAPDTGGGETGLAEGQRGGMWLPPEQPEITEIVTSVGNPNFYTSVPWHLMIDMGFMEEEGFDAEFFVSSEVYQGVTGKDIHFGNKDADNVIVGLNEGVPVVQIACHRDHEWHMFGLSPSIKKPEDLIGKKAIMGTPGTRSYEQRRGEILNWSGGLVDADRDLEAIVLSGGSDAYHQAIISDQVQIGSQYVRHMKPLLDAGANFFIAGIFEYPQEAIITHQDYINDAPRTVVNFLRAWLKALNLWRDWTMKAEIKALAKDLHDMDLTPEFDNAWASQVDMMAPEGAFRTIAMKQFLDDLVFYDVIPEGTVYQDFHYQAPLAQAQKELLGLQWPPPEAVDLFTILGVSTKSEF